MIGKERRMEGMNLIKKKTSWILFWIIHHTGFGLLVYAG